MLPAGIKIGFDPVSYPDNREDVGFVTLMIKQFDRAPGIDANISVLFNTVDGTAEGKFNFPQDFEFTKLEVPGGICPLVIEAAILMKWCALMFLFYLWLPLKPSFSPSAGLDYDSTSQELIFRDGDDVLTVNVPIIQDGMFDGEENSIETFLGMLTLAAGFDDRAEIVAPQATVEIVDIDGKFLA